MNWHLIKSQESKTLVQVTLYDSVLAELRRISEKENVAIRTLVRSAVNDAIEEYHKLEATQK